MTRPIWGLALAMAINVLATSAAATGTITNVNLVGLFVASSELPIYQEAMRPTLQMASEEAMRRYPNLNISIQVRQGSNSCQTNRAGAHAAEAYYQDGVSAFIGPACSIALDAVGRMASYWNVPVFTAGGIAADFANKNLYTSLTRLSFSMDRVSHFLIKVLSEFDWHHISLIVDETDLAFSLIRQSLEDVLKLQDFAIGTKVEPKIKLDIQAFTRRSLKGELTNRTIDYKRYLKSASKSARVILLVASGELVRQILLEAYDLGMNNGEYSFIGIELIKNRQSYGDFSWYQPGDKRNKQAREMFESFMVVSVRVPVSPEYNTFVHEVAKRSHAEFGAGVVQADVNPITAAFYDCVLMYAWALNKTLAVGGDPMDGRALVRQLWNQTFLNGLTGDIYINENGDREADYTLNDLDPETGVMVPVATYYGARRYYEKHAGMDISWPGGAVSPPRDMPLCGFTGEARECLLPAPFPVAATVIAVTFTLVAFAVSAAFFVYSKIKMESALADSWWKVKWDEISFNEKSGRKSTTSLANSEGSIRTTKASQSHISAPSQASSKNSTCANVQGVLVGSYRGIRVAVKELEVKRIAINRQVLLELKVMRELTHENLSRFVGMCVEEPNFALLTELCTRGSLRDMLENESIKIDWMFKYSMITDIVEGILYLHNSAIGCHGRLKSANCVIDSRFMVKLTNYGLNEVHRQITRMDQDGFNPRSLFWTAPEHLRDKDPFLSSSKKGDIYSFAIILQEVITRCGPFEAPERLGRKRAPLGPEEILDRLRMGTVPPFRPEVAPDEAPVELLDLMHACWAEDPILRPDIQILKPRMKRITKGVSSRNFLDNLLNRMEQYANNLEQIVDEKTESLIEEKRKTEEILYQLLPRFVAEELKVGNTVTPEAYDSVTIFFSDIVGFTSLSAESTPLQVVDLLNDLYTTFDAIIDNYDVYKVETIGDAYMVASGLPIRNGHDHAREICRMALDLRDAMKVFKIRHRPERKLEVRIGVHSGSCVAGVVGLRMPRYCLFGDTVNTASRMETNGEPLKVHISQATRDILMCWYDSFVIELRGDVDVKGKGPMTTFWLVKEDTKPQPPAYSKAVSASDKKIKDSVSSSRKNSKEKDASKDNLKEKIPPPKDSSKDKQKALPPVKAPAVDADAVQAPAAANNASKVSNAV